jgi:phospholipase/carboxylesterase
MQQTDLSLKTEINLYYDLHIPEGSENAPLLIAVHGYGAHKRYMMREAKAVAPENFVIAAPQAPHQHFRKTDDGYRIGYGWLTDFKPEEYVRLHHDFLLGIIDKLTREGRIDPARIYLYGFSQSCALNFRFAFTYPEILRGIVAVCGGIPGDLDTNECYQAFTADTFYLYGDDDEYYTHEKFVGFDEKLRSILPNFESKQFAATHEITEDMRVEIRNFFARF